jgi:hypothetical protein
MDASQIIEVIYPFLIILYLIEGIIYVRKYHLLFISLTGRRFQLKGSGLQIVGFLPFSQAFLSHSNPLYFTSDGLYISQNHHMTVGVLLRNTDYEFLRYEDIDQVQAEERLLKIDEKSVRIHSAKYTNYVKDFINKLKVANPVHREQDILTFFLEVTNAEEIRGKWDRFNRSARWLKIFVAMLFVYIFFVLPLILYSKIGVYFNLHRLLFLMAMMYLFVFVIQIVLHKKLYRGDTRDRISISIRMLLSPVSSLHAVNILSRDLFWRFDYIALAAELLPRDTFKNLVSRELWLSDYLEVKVGCGALVDWWKFRKKYLESLLAEKGISKVDVLASPTKEDELAARYCPLCSSGYRSGFIVCSDCGVDLMNFR